MSEETTDATEEEKAFVGIQAPIRSVLVAMLQDGDRDMRYPVLTIGMPCGAEYIFEDREEVPEKTLMCSCGNPKHIVIQYFHEAIDDSST
jgi:hypothetical protein